MQHTISSKVTRKGAKNRNKSRMLDAVAVYLEEKGPSTVWNIAEGARFKNGRLLRNNNSFKSTVSLALILSRSPRFLKHKKLTKENIYLWENACDVTTEELNTGGI